MKKLLPYVKLCLKIDYVKSTDILLRDITGQLQIVCERGGLTFAKEQRSLKLDKNYKFY